jgi:hypothetical protein
MWALVRKKARHVEDSRPGPGRGPVRHASCSCHHNLDTRYAILYLPEALRETASTTRIIPKNGETKPWTIPSTPTWLMGVFP